MRPSAGTQGGRPLREDDRFRLIVEQVSEYAIFMLDPSGRVQTWNAGAERIKGYRADEILGQHISKFYPADNRHRAEELLAIAREKGRVSDEGWRLRKDGSRFWASVVITCLHDNGDIVGYAKVTKDLTEQRRAQEALRESHERFRLLVETVQDYAIFMLDPAGYVTTWNVGAERIKGYASHEIIGEHFSRFYPEAEIRAGKCDHELAVAASVGRFEDEGWRLRKDGSQFWANVVITALRDRDGTLVGFAKITRDLSERRRAEELTRALAATARARLQTLADLSEALAAATTVAEVGASVIDKGLQFAKGDTCTLYLLDPNTEVLHLVAEKGCNPAIVEAIRTIARDAGNPSYAIGTNTAPPVFIETAAEYQRFFPAMAQRNVTGPRARAFWAVPLEAENHPMGMLAVGFHTERSFSPDEREFIATFARLCGQAIARAQRLDAERATAALMDRLRASLETTLRSIGDAVITTNAAGEVAMMNAVAEDLTGWREADAKGRPLPEVFHIVNEQTREVVPSPVEKVLATGGVVGLANHTVLLARDGRQIPIDDSGAPIRTEGKIEGVVLVFRDVTEKKLEESRRNYLSDATALLAGSLNYEDTVAKVAELAVPRLADWCAVDLVVEGEARPRRLAITHADPSKVVLVQELTAKYPFNPRTADGLAAVLRDGRARLYPQISDDLLAQNSIDAEHLRLARELELHSGMVVPLVARGRVLGAMSFFQAESGRTYAEADLRFAEELARRCAQAIENARVYSSEQAARRSADIANRAKDEFLAVVSHELRTPLNAIMGWAKLLAIKSDDEQRLRRALDTIERNAVAMAQLIEDLLDMSRVISGKMRIEIQSVDVPLVVEAAIDSIRPAALAKNVDLRAFVEPSVPRIIGDPNRLQQVVWNLLSNAVKFTAKGGRVEVMVAKVESSIEIVVADNGQGMDSAFLPHVFDAFRQEETGATRAKGGLGLGLAISRQLVELHGGRIKAHSEGPGCGATFIVCLPISMISAPQIRSGDDRRQIEAKAKVVRPPQLQGLRVLVVEDDDDARALVASILEECGSVVALAANVDEAMAHMERGKPDVLLSDVSMPGEDGFSLIKKVRALPRDRGGDVPAAAITAYARAEDRKQLLSAGFSIHLPKPIEPEELIAVVASLSRFAKS